MTRSSRGKGASGVFLTAAALLLVLLIFLAFKSSDTWRIYRAEEATTPVPTATVHSVNVTHDPSVVTATPAPTAVYMASGSAGDGVKQLQNALKELGFYTGEVDGQFGRGTRDAVELFQSQHGLQADGIVGEKTWEMILSGNAHRVEITPTPAATDTLSGDMPLLVNRQRGLSADFQPADLVTIKDVAPEGVFLYKKEGLQGVRTAGEALIRMVQAAQNEGITPWQISESYRTYADQQRIFENRVSQYLKENEGASRERAVSATRQTVADPGQSEHHTGLAFDLTVPGAYFSDTAQYAWLARNCWDYGFIMRYTDEKEDITGFMGEEWHVRYVGVEHSLKMRDMDMCLEEYVAYLQKN